MSQPVPLSHINRSMRFWTAVPALVWTTVAVAGLVAWFAWSCQKDPGPPNRAVQGAGVAKLGGDAVCSACHEAKTAYHRLPHDIQTSRSEVRVLPHVSRELHACMAPLRRSDPGLRAGSRSSGSNSRPASGSNGRRLERQAELRLGPVPRGPGELEVARPVRVRVLPSYTEGAGGLRATPNEEE